jgi:LytS/YehU family sensor histidine kinase
VSLREEILFLKTYLEIEKVRYRTAIHINFETQGIDSAHKITPLLFLPFIENAFKHGIEEEELKGFINIIICNTEEELTLEVINSIAKPKENLGGIGLANVRKRLEILYPNRHQLAIENDGNVYRVNLTLT